MIRKLTLSVAALALTAAFAHAETIKVGVSPGEHAEIMDEVAKLAKPKGLDIEVIEFQDYVMPNQALADGDLNANSFQHKPYLDQQVKDRGYDLAVIGTTITTPMGLYSDKVKSVADLPDGASIAIPNDPTNGGRALLILQDLGLVTLKPDVGLTPTPLDIAENPKNITISELDAAQIPRALPDVDAALINTNYALSAGLNPKKDAIAMEKPDSPYANLIVVRKGDEDKDWAKELVEIYHSPEIKTFIETKYDGAVIPSF